MNCRLVSGTARPHAGGSGSTQAMPSPQLSPQPLRLCSPLQAELLPWALVGPGEHSPKGGSKASSSLKSGALRKLGWS